MSAMTKIVNKDNKLACMVLPNVTVLISFFSKDNKKILIHKEKSHFLKDQQLGSGNAETT